MTRDYLTPDQSEAVAGQDGVEGLEVSGAASPAVTRASGGDTLGLGAGVVGTARVTGLGANASLGEASDTTLSVVDGGTEGADGTTVDTGGGTGAADAGSNGGNSASGDGKVTLAVAVNGSGEGVSAGSADVGHVAAGEDGAGEGSKGGTAGGGSRSTSTTAVASSDEAGGDREANGASGASVDEVGVATTDGDEGLRHLLNGANLKLALGETDLSGQSLGMGGAVSKRLQDELVGLDVDVVGSDAGCGAGLETLNVQVVKSQLSLLKLREAVGQDSGDGASSGHLLGQGLVSDTDVDGLAVIGHPSTGEGVTDGAAKLLDDVGGLDLTGDTSSGLLGVQAQVALHGLENLGVEAFGSLSGCTVGNGQGDCQEGEEFGELHVGKRKRR